jgi:hypothetical protein
MIRLVCGVRVMDLVGSRRTADGIPVTETVRRVRARGIAGTTEIYAASAARK